MIIKYLCLFVLSCHIEEYNLVILRHNVIQTYQNEYLWNDSWKLSIQFTASEPDIFYSILHALNLVICTIVIGGKGRISEKSSGLIVGQMCSLVFHIFNFIIFRSYDICQVQ